MSRSDTIGSPPSEARTLVLAGISLGLAGTGYALYHLVMAAALSHGIVVLAAAIGALLASLAFGLVFVARRSAPDITRLQSWTSDLRAGTLTLRPGENLVWPPGTYALATFIEQVHSADRDQFTTAWGAAIRGAPIDIKCRVLSDDQLRWVHLKAHVAPTSDDRGRFVSGIAQDITEQQQTEELVCAQRDLARLISSVTSDHAAWPLCLSIALRVAGMDSGGIYLFDIDHRNLDLVYSQGLSAEFVKSASRYSPESPNVQMIRQGLSFFLNATEIGQRPALLSEGLQSIAVIPVHHQGRILGCINISSHTLRVVPVVARRALETIAAEIGSAIVYIRTMAALSSEQLRFAKVAAALPGAICTFRLRPDGALCIPYASAAFEEIYGLTRAEVATSIEPISARIPPDQVFTLLANVAESARTLQPWRNEYQYQHPRNGSIWLEGYAMPIREAEDSTVWHGFVTDITERKLAETQLRQSRERIEFILRGANIGTWDWYVQTNTLVINERWAEMLGYHLDELMPISIQTWIDLCHPEDLERSNALLDQHFAGETEFYECEARLRHRHGGWVWVVDRGKVLEWDASGRPIRMSGTHLDITARKQAEQELLELNRTLEERVRQRTAEVQDLYENAPVGYHSLDTQGRVMMVNQTHRYWLGYTRDEMVGQSLTAFLTPESVAAFQVAFAEFKEHGWARDVEQDMVRKDGSIMPVLVSATAIYDEQGEYVMSRSTVFDNSRRKQTENALRESEQQNRLLFEKSPDAVALFDERGRVVQLNRAFELLTGHPGELLVGRTLDALGIISPAQAIQLAKTIIQHLETNSDFAAVELRLRRANGEVRDAGARAFGIALYGHQHFLCTMRDITTEKKVEETLRRANTELAQAGRTKDEFLANMSHELRTPLNAILALSESLLEQIRGPLNARQQELLMSIETSGRHLLAIINDILDLSKVEAGRLDLLVDPVPIAEVCRASLLLVKEMAARKSLQLTLELNNQVRTIRADAKRLKQMLVNLLSNAIKFTPSGGRVSLTVNTDTEAGVVHFVVQDSGIGIAPDDLVWLFQPFKQLDSSLNRDHEGTGLGLALVRRLAELHGGGIAVESEVDKGSRFTIALPYCGLPETTPQYQTAPLAIRQPASLRTALIVDDSESTADQLARYLGEAGLEALIHPRGEGALDQVIALQPDVIFLDVIMSDQSGWSVLLQLKADPRTRHIPVVIVSVVDDQARGLAAGAVAYLVKPISRDVLRQVLQTVTAAPEQQPEPGLVAAPEPAQFSARILLAEDNEINIEAVSDYLEAVGYEVLVAHDGHEALAVAAASQPDLILMDVQMPELDGLEAMRRLRVRPEFADTPIIALTALAMTGDRERCLEAGASEYLTKPVSLKALVATIERLLHPAYQ